MTTEPLPTGPDPEAITRTIQETWPETDVVEMPGAVFFSLDAEKHFPNYATLVTTDEFEDGTPSKLARPGVFRLNIGVGRETFERLIGSTDEPDYAVLDQLLPHPVYAKQHWISILNPSEGSFREVVLPLLTEAHDRLAAARATPCAWRRRLILGDGAAAIPGRRSRLILRWAGPSRDRWRGRDEKADREHLLDA
jgi:hypothetical protein